MVCRVNGLAYCLSRISTWQGASPYGVPLGRPVGLLTAAGNCSGAVAGANHFSISIQSGMNGLEQLALPHAGWLLAQPARHQLSLRLPGHAHPPDHLLEPPLPRLPRPVLAGPARRPARQRTSPHRQCLLRAKTSYESETDSQGHTRPHAAVSLVWGLSHLEQEPGRLRQPDGGVEGCCRERLLAERSMAPSEQLSGAHL